MKAASSHFRPLDLVLDYSVQKQRYMLLTVYVVDIKSMRTFGSLSGKMCEFKNLLIVIDNNLNT